MNICIYLVQVCVQNNPSVNGDRDLVIHKIFEDLIQLVAKRPQDRGMVEHYSYLIQRIWRQG
jgi:hypothetical protein